MPFIASLRCYFMALSDKDFLKLNPNQIIAYLQPIISPTELAKIKGKVKKQISAMLFLSREHLSYAKGIKHGLGWRQKVSRSYYCCYIASRALRVAVSGSFDQTAGDHNNIIKIPDDFPDNHIWINFLKQFRSDRNIADYDHEAKTVNLDNKPNDYITKAEIFYNLVKDYLQARGDI